jgi:hypothetical protein
MYAVAQHSCDMPFSSRILDQNNVTGPENPAFPIAGDDFYRAT